MLTIAGGIVLAFFGLIALLGIAMKLEEPGIDRRRRLEKPFRSDFAQ